jgi:cell division protein FtsQ
LLSGVAVLLWLGPHVRRYVCRHPYFAVEAIEVSAGPRLTRGDVLRLGRLREGMSLWEVSAAEVERRLERSPWVRTARVQRRFPRRLEVTVVERRPRAIVFSGRPLYVDRRGYVIAGLGAGDDRDLPYVSGVEVGAASAGRPALARAMRVLGLAEKYGWPDDISEVHVGEAGRLSVFLAGRTIVVLLPEVGWQEQMAPLRTVMTIWAQRRAAPAVMDARFSEQIVVRPLGSPGKTKRPVGRRQETAPRWF